MHNFMKQLTISTIIILSFLPIQSSSKRYISDDEIVDFLKNPTVKGYIAQLRIIKNTNKRLTDVMKKIGPSSEQAEFEFQKYVESGKAGAVIYRKLNTSQTSMLFAIQYQTWQPITQTYSVLIEKRKQMAGFIYHGTSRKGANRKNGTFR